MHYNRRWAHAVAAALLKHRLTNVSIRIEPAGREPPLADSSYCAALDGAFDVVVVDG